MLKCLLLTLLVNVGHFRWWVRVTDGGRGVRLAGGRGEGAWVFRWIWAGRRRRSLWDLLDMAEEARYYARLREAEGPIDIDGREG